MDVFALAAKISLDTNEYTTSLDEASGKTQTTGEKIKSGLATAAKVGGVAVAGLSAGLVKGAKDTAEYGDNIDKMSQKLGMTSTAYQEWDFIMQHCGTSISAMQPAMKTLATAAETNSDAFEKLGISQQEIANMSQEELFSATIAALQNCTDETERTYLAGKLLGRGATELGPLLNTSAEDVEGMRQKVHELGGVMSEEAVKDAATYQDSLQDLQYAFDGIKRTILENLLPIFSQLMDFVSDGIAKFRSLDEGTQNLILKFSGITAAVAPILVVFSKISSGISSIISVGAKLIPGIGKLSTSLVKLFALIATNPIALLVAAIAAAVAALIYFWNTNEDFRNAVKGIWDAIVGFFKDAAEFIKGAFEGIKEFFKGVWDGIKEAFGNVKEFFEEKFSNAKEAIQNAWSGVKEFFSEIWGNIKEKASEMWENIKEKASGALENVREKWSTAKEFFAGVWENIKTRAADAWENIKSKAASAWDAVKTKWGETKEFFAGVWENVKTTAASAWEAVKTKGAEAWAGVKDTWSAGKEFLASLWDSTKEKAASAWEAVKEKGTSAWENVKSAWGSSKEFFGGVWENISSKFSEAPAFFKDKFSSAWENTKSAFGNVKGFFEGKWSDIKGAFSGALAHFKGIGRDMLTGLWNGIADKVEWLKGKVRGVVDKIKGWFTGKDGFDEHSPSKWAKQVFQYVMEGGGQGLDAGSAALFRDVDAIVNRMKDSMDVSPVNLGFSASGQATGAGSSTASAGGNTYVTINSPVAVDAIQAAREWKKTTQRMALGYV